LIRLTDLRSERGFTLIELMVVVLILGVLLAMSMSTFSGVKERAQDSAAKSTAATALETGRIVFTDAGNYTNVFAANLSAAEPSLRFVDEVTNSSGPNNASTWVPDRATTGYQFVAAVYSESGKCFFVRDWITQGLGFGVDPGVGPADCTADQAVSVIFLTSWPTT
jgi:prepilin-type N-terminal cleavage/methylation domain-containing protein